MPTDAALRSEVAAFVEAHGLEGNAAWFFKAEGLQLGAGVEFIDGTPAADLAADLKIRIENAVRADGFKNPKWVLQPALAPRLFGGRKVSARIYLLLARGRGNAAPEAYLYGEGLLSRGRDAYADRTFGAAVVHGGDGDRMGPLSDLAESGAWWPSITAATRDLLKSASADVWKRALPGADYWVLLGLDFLPCDDGSLKLLEVNTGPRLWLDDGAAGGGDGLRTVDARVTRPLLLDTVDLVARLRLRRGPPAADNAWRPVGPAAPPTLGSF